MPDILDGVPTNETYKLKVVPEMADINAPSIATEYDATGAVDIECLQVSPLDADVSVEKNVLRRACSNRGREVSGQETRSIADLIVVLDPQDLSDPLSAAYNTLEPNKVVYLVQRAGIHVDTAAAVGQLVDVYKVRVNSRIKLTPADNDEWQAKIGVSVLDWATDVALVA